MEHLGIGNTSRKERPTSRLAAAAAHCLQQYIKRQKAEEDRKSAVNVTDAIKHVEFGSGAWNVSEKIIFFASCMHVRPWLSASISWIDLAAAMQKMAAYFRLTFKAE